MSSYARIGVGIIGYGIGRIYATAFHNAGIYYQGFPPIDLVGVCTQSQASLEKAKNHFGFQIATTDYHELLERDDINVIVVATPNNLHFPMLMDSLKSHQAIYTDKPLTRELDEARQVADFAQQLGKDLFIGFQYRFSPAMQMAHQLIQDGRIGQIYSFRGSYFRSSYVNLHKSVRWKGKFAGGGHGVLSDLASHVLDLMTWLIGMPTKVSAQLRTFIPERPSGKDGSLETVETDDHALLQLSLDDGGVGTVEVGRLITGAVMDVGIEVYGSLGSLRWNLMDSNYLYFAERQGLTEEQGWTRIPTVTRYPGAFLPDPDFPDGMMRCYIAAAAEFLRSTLEGKPYDPGLQQGLRIQTIIEAAAQSDGSGAWVEV
jgi:predicted dehydrogenase